MLWKKNLENLSIFYLVSFRALFTFLISFIFAYYFDSFSSITYLQVLKVTTGSVFGVIGLLCMLSVIKKASLQWLGVYNLIGILFTTGYLFLFERIEFRYSFVGVLLILSGFIYYIFSNKNRNLRMTIQQHLLMFLMTFSFSISSIIHWENLFKEIPPLVIISNQEMVVFITTVIGLLVTDKTQMKFSFYKKHFFKVVAMAFVIFLALLFSFLGLKQTNPIVSSLLFLASPLTTIVMNIVFFKEHLSKHNIVALFLMSVGAFILHFLTV
jgi:drug/metabolite transporter (DMT)-like permease